MSPSRPLTPAQIEALQARFALRVSARLDEGARDLPHDITERLRVARGQAVAAARQALRETAAVPVSATSEATSPAGLVLAGAGGGPRGVAAGTSWHRDARGPGRPAPEDDSPSWGWRFASALPLLALLAGLWGIGEWKQQEQVEAAVDVDLALLTDDLPPTAYSDEGFEEFLRADVPGESPAPLDAAPAEPALPELDPGLVEPAQMSS